MKFYEIRDPIYGFIRLNELEMDIVNHPVFQRLRRIKQLGFTEMVYPSAKHSRFEHSLGVMDLATRLYDEIAKKNSHILKEIGGIRQRRLYVLPEEKNNAKNKLMKEGLL